MKPSRNDCCGLTKRSTRNWPNSLPLTSVYNSKFEARYWTPSREVWVSSCTYSVTTYCPRATVKLSGLTLHPVNEKYCCRFEAHIYCVYVWSLSLSVKKKPSCNVLSPASWFYKLRWKNKSKSFLSDGKLKACLILLYMSCWFAFVRDYWFQNRWRTRNEPGNNVVMFCNLLLQDSCFIV
jgi:hypothetical protein